MCSCTYLYFWSIKTSWNVWQVISESPFWIRYVTYQYNTQQMYDEVVNDCLA